MSKETIDWGNIEPLFQALEERAAGEDIPGAARDDLEDALGELRGEVLALEERCLNAMSEAEIAGTYVDDEPCPLDAARTLARHLRLESADKVRRICDALQAGHESDLNMLF
ncbi:hypothetical protein [Hyphomonas pacifica]|uniref:Uncharacterized protein n=1 Tax=Hyphomonas pacifica TaxID=1280941 RepID=A0A8B2PR95_9PROT|nr:hypothetical protein [Hyphomonas pacifica]RAN30649.1 hypothetical protein HY3_05725 [Hyphomonas pacifica]